MLHDLSGFTWNARSERGPLIVVIDNDGGGIFSLLPQATTLQPPEFERYFGTPHGLDLAAIGRAVGAHLATVDRAGELIPALESLDHLPGLRMVTVRVDRRRAGDLREQVASAVHQALSGS